MTAHRRRAAWPRGLALAGLVAGCQPLPHPFADDRPPAALLAVPDSIDIAVGSFEGEPHATGAKLPAAIAQELLKHNIPASDQTTNYASYRLDGRIEEHPDQPGQSLVTVFWRLRDALGRIVSERTDRLAAPTRDWDDGNDQRIAQLAAAGAGGLAALLTEDTPKEQAGGGRIRVAIRKIAGAPGDGDDSLVSSLTAVLKHQDLELVDAAKGKPDLDVDAEVTVDPAKADKQHVKIIWHVARASGKEIGTVGQENDIPRGRLDGPWGDVAYNIAMAAEGGIMQLVDRGAPPQKLGAEASAAAASAASLDTLGAPSASAVPPVAGNLQSPEVNLPPVTVTPLPGAMPAPLQEPPAPLPYRGVPVPH
jgi:hypothetical protein